MTSIPASADAIDAAWLQQALAPRHPGARIGFDEAWLAHRLYASYAVLACCQVVTFPPDATPKRRVFAESLLARAEAAIADLEAREALRELAV